MYRFPENYKPYKFKTSKNPLNILNRSSILRYNRGECSFGCLNDSFGVMYTTDHVGESTKVDAIKIPKTTINISDISKCSTVPEEWDQHLSGPVQYVAPKVITPTDKPIKVDEQQILHQKSRHKRHKSEGRISLDESHRSDPEQNRSHPSVGIRHKYRPLEIKTIQPISRQEEMQPRLVRTDSIYPNLEGLLPFNLVVKGTSKDPDYIKVEEGHSQGQEEEVQHSQDPEPRTDQERIDKRKSQWLSHFLVEYYRETTSATMEGRIANLYSLPSIHHHLPPLIIIVWLHC